MSIDKTLIEGKLYRLNQYLKRIEEMHFSEEEFFQNVDYQDLLTFRLQQAVETAIDIATHIISSLALEKPETARSSFEVLTVHKIITKGLSEKMMLAVSFRNIIVHGYEEFDFKQLFYDYRDDINNLKNFIKEIMIFLNK